MGVLDSGSRDYLDRIGFHAGSEPSVAGSETGFMDNFTASAENFAFHFKSTSEADTMTDLINSQLDLIYAHKNPDFRFNPKHKDGLNIKRDLTGKEKVIMAGTKALLPLMGASVASPGTNIFDYGYEGKKKRFQDMTHEILAIQAQDPNTKIKTWDQIMDDARGESQRLKEILSQVSNTRTWAGVAGNLTGVMKEALTDPFVLASMGLGWRKITGGTKSLNAAKAFLTEFAIGAGSETLIQPYVMDWSAKLETPWSLKDAAVTILTVGGFAGVTRAAGSYVVDVAEAAKASKILRSQGETVKADTLDNFIDLFNGAPAARDVLDQDIQLKAMDEIQLAIDSGKSGPELQLEVERIAKETGLDLDVPVLSKEIEEELILNAKSGQGNKLGVSNGKGAMNEGLLKVLNERLGPDAVERYVREVFEVAKTNLKNSSKSDKDKARLTQALEEQLVRDLEDVRTRVTKVDAKPEVKPDKVIKLQELTRTEVERVNTEFRAPGQKLNLDVDQYHAAAIPFQEELEAVGRAIQDELKELVGFMSPGIKQLENVREKMGRKAYSGTHELTDVIRLGFLAKDYGSTETIINRLSQKFEILDEGLVTTPAGYRDHKFLVRFKNGMIGEIQMWEPHILAVKSGQEFVDEFFPKYMAKYVSNIDIPNRANSGHAIYDKSKKLWKNGKLSKANKIKFDKLTERQVKLYSLARRASNISWNSALETNTPLSKISAPEAGSQAPGSAARGTTQADLDPSASSTTTAGLPSQSTKLDTSSQLNINSTSKPIIPGDTERILLNDPQLAKMIDEEFIEAQRIIDEFGDELEVPFTLIDDLGNEVTVVQSVKKVFNDLDEEKTQLDLLNKCMGRAA